MRRAAGLALLLVLALPGWVLSGWVLSGPAARAQPAPALTPTPTPEAAVPEALRGAWFRGGCESPAAMLALSARSAARVPAEGAARLLRFTEWRRQGEWSVTTARGAEAPRLMLRAAGDALETAEPSNKAREDRLPGDAPLTAWRRCPIPPAAALLHAEGIAFLGALEVLEAGCAEGVPACAEALVRVGDVSGDRLVGPAEVARLLRGASWVLAVQAGSTPEGLGLVGGAGALGGVAAARLIVESLDYDGDGRLSARELAQDRATLLAGGTAAGRPLALERIGEGVALLRGLYEGLTASE
ncbi:hypothetical protein [Muricoccus radiodurans]|uniref:hypothetical protein n=1 Tax=Muricoccus radiodurans TaxID=2231721 RepID=UPI003CECDA8A